MNNRQLAGDPNYQNNLRLAREFALAVQGGKSRKGRKNSKSKSRQKNDLNGKDKELDQTSLRQAPKTDASDIFVSPSLSFVTNNVSVATLSDEASKRRILKPSSVRSSKALRSLKKRELQHPEKLTNPADFMSAAKFRSQIRPDASLSRPVLGSATSKKSTESVSHFSSIAAYGLPLPNGLGITRDFSPNHSPNSHLNNLRVMDTMNPTLPTSLVPSGQHITVQGENYQKSREFSSPTTYSVNYLKSFSNITMSNLPFKSDASPILKCDAQLPSTTASTPSKYLHSPTYINYTNSNDHALSSLSNKGNGQKNPNSGNASMEDVAFDVCFICYRLLR